MLPNLGALWRFNSANQVYVSYSEELSSLRTDSFYTVQRNADGSIGSLNAQPETSKTIEAGYRYQTRSVQATASVYDTKFHNRIVSTLDPDTNTYRERNVGDLDVVGAEGQLLVRPVEHLTVQGVVTYTDAEYQNQLLVQPGVYLNLVGKQLVETPKWMWGGRVGYDFGDLSMSLQGKYVGKRYATDMNDLAVQDYITFDADLRYDLHYFGLKNTYVQLNVINILDRDYYGNLGTQFTADPALKTLAKITAQPYGSVGAPRTVQASLKVSF